MSKTIVVTALAALLSVSACGTTVVVTRPNTETASAAPADGYQGVEPGPEFYHDPEWDNQPEWDYEPDEIECMVSGVGNWSGGMCHF